MYLGDDEDDVANDYKKRNLVILLIILFNQVFQSTYKYPFLSFMLKMRGQFPCQSSGFGRILILLYKDNAI